ncbi:hypothetical protein Gogos_011474 [Gossypium gossypioides]|uniref:ER membrane protein complex subunit 6 n=1 Tax=Gossypium gossypioides TaxID=34282 RepID=A0A7J9BPG3_GOSGO|nr:hypothetical protein [Gossypium gossypioides]
MAGHSDSSSSEKKSSEAMNDVPTFSTENMQNNMKVIYYSRTFMSIIGGVIAGILGFTGFMGFIFYFLVMAITSIGLIAKAKFSVHLYFDSWNRIILDGFMGGLMSFVLFWTYPFFLAVLHGHTIALAVGPYQVVFAASLIYLLLHRFCLLVLSLTSTDLPTTLCIYSEEESATPHRKEKPSCCPCLLLFAICWRLDSLGLCFDM